MAALVPLGGARSRPRRRRGISVTHDGVTLERCITLEEEGLPLNNGVCSESTVNNQRRRTTQKRKRTTDANTPSAAEEPIPELPDEIVLDILVRLPVKSLLCCKSVCKAWLAIITNPSFVRAHLKCSASRCEKNPCVVITPHTIGHQFIPGGPWPTTFSNHIRFYQWQQGASMATLMHDKDFGNEFRCVRAFAQCDGLVLVPSDTGLYLFNPATRETLALPDNRDNNRRHSPMRSCCCCAGLGLDPQTGKYKVVRAFFRSVDPDTYMGRDMGMEVFTILENGKSAWREIRDDLPYPPENWRTAMAVNGFLFWRLSDQDPPWGLLQFSLADETFGITRLPDSMDLIKPDAFTLDVLNGELCVLARTLEGTVTMWMLPIQEEDGGQGQSWEQRYTIHLTSMYRPMAFLPGGRIMLNFGNKICSYDLATAELTTMCEMDRLKYQGRRARSWKNLFIFNAHLYTESLVRITA